MKTAEEVIELLRELPVEEQQKVADFLNTELEEGFPDDHFSPEETAQILQAGEEARQGINMSGPFYTTEELFAHLDSLQPE